MNYDKYVFYKNKITLKDCCESDIIVYDEDGFVEWQLWSSHTNCWAPGPIEWLKRSWPSKYEDMIVMAKVEANKLRAELGKEAV